MELKRDDMRERLVTRGLSGEATFDLTSEWPEKPCETWRKSIQGKGKRPLGVRENGMFWEQTAGSQHWGKGCETSLRTRQDEAPAGFSGQGEGVRFYSQRDGNAGWMSRYFVCHLVYSFTKVHPAAGWRRDPRPGTSVDLK